MFTKIKTSFIYLSVLANTAAKIVVAIVAPIMLLAPVAQANSVSLIWSSTSGAGITGSDTILAAAGDELILDVILEAGTSGISIYGISLRFDTDLANELDLNGQPLELLPPGFQFNTTPGVEGVVESDATTAGQVQTIEGVTFGAGPASTSFLIGQISFLVTGNVATDGSDIFSGLFNTGVDGLFDSNSLALTDVAFGTATVQVVPLPAAAWLFASAVLGLGALRKKFRRAE